MLMQHDRLLVVLRVNLRKESINTTCYCNTREAFLFYNKILYSGQLDF